MFYLSVCCESIDIVIHFIYFVMAVSVGSFHIFFYLPSTWKFEPAYFNIVSCEIEILRGHFKVLSFSIFLISLISLWNGFTMSNLHGFQFPSSNNFDVLTFKFYLSAICENLLNSTPLHMLCIGNVGRFVCMLHIWSKLCLPGQKSMPIQLATHLFIFSICQ